MTFITTSERSAKSITVSERAKVGISATAREALTFQDGVPNLRLLVAQRQVLAAPHLAP